MTLVDDNLSAVGGQLTRAAFLVIRSEGLCIPRLDKLPQRPVTFLESFLLRLLASGVRPDKAIDRAVRNRDADPDEALAFLDELRERRWLVEDGKNPPPIVDPPEIAEPTDEPGELPDGAQLIAALPLILSVDAEGFRCVDHFGHTRALLDEVELDVLCQYRVQRDWREALREHRQDTGNFALREAQFCAVSARLHHAGLLLTHRAGDPAFLTPRDRAREIQLTRIRNLARLAHHTDLGLLELEDQGGRTNVVPIQNNGTFAPMAIGAVIAHARQHKGGVLEEAYAFRPDWYASRRPAEDLVADAGVFLFSDYVWSHAQNLEVSERVKAASPASLTIHGGPDCPKQLPDTERYMAVNPHIDVIVHGEGEVTLAETLEAMAGRLGDGPPDLSVLADVPGLTYRDGDRIVRTADRDRIADLSVLASPLLTGLFDALGEARVSVVTLETNRGCPYGCTFCDWGSSTLSRIRKFELERVFAEIEWCGRNQIPNLWFADANFGIFERDVEIAEKVAEVKEKYGFPLVVGTNYAKNTAKHLKKIVATWVDAGMVGNGILSLQSTDPGVLATIERTNIKVEKYDALAQEFRRARLALFVDLMVGLPGSTTTSFRNDLQDCIDREIMAKIFQTTMLPNSPMNDPDYRTKHRIEVAEPREAGKGNPLTQLVVSSATFTREDMDEWLKLRRVFLVVENYGVLRHVSRYVRHETGQREIDFYVQMIEDVEAAPETWPHLSFLVRGAAEPPGPTGQLAALPRRGGSVPDRAGGDPRRLGAGDGARRAARAPPGARASVPLPRAARPRLHRLAQRDGRGQGGGAGLAGRCAQPARARPWGVGRGRPGTGEPHRIGL